METNQAPITERVDNLILFIRGHKVMLDSHLAELYQAETRVLNQAVKRNHDRFPEDFMFQLTKEEAEALKYQPGILNLRSQSVTSSYGGRRYLPYVFTEHGAIMAANVLNSPIATKAAIQVVRAFVRLRRMLIENAELAKKLLTLEAKYDDHFKVVFKAIRQLMDGPPEPEKPKIGFRVDNQ